MHKYKKRIVSPGSTGHTLLKRIYIFSNKDNMCINAQNIYFIYKCYKVDVFSLSIKKITLLITTTIKTVWEISRIQLFFEKTIFLV